VPDDATVAALRKHISAALKVPMGDIALSRNQALVRLQAPRTPGDTAGAATSAAGVRAQWPQQGTAVSGRARGAAADVPGGGAAHAVPGPGARGRHAAAPGPAARRPGAPQSRPQACRPATTPPVWPPPTDSLLSACRQPPCFAAPPRHGLSALWRRTLDSEAHLLLEGGTSSLPSLRPWCAERVPPPAGARAEHTNGAALGRSSCTRRSSGPWSLPRARPRGGLVRRRPAALPWAVSCACGRHAPASSAIAGTQRLCALLACMHLPWGLRPAWSAPPEPAACLPIAQATGAHPIAAASDAGMTRGLSCEADERAAHAGAKMTVEELIAKQTRIERCGLAQHAC